MATTVDTIDIQISADSSKATRAIDSLKNTLKRLQTLISGAGKAGTTCFNGMVKGAKTAARVIKSIAGAPFVALKKGFSGLSAKVSGFFAMFKKRLMYRAINAMISAISSSIKEGIDNVYQYSKLLNGQFSKSMDSAATHLLYFKNSLGAMFAPLINLLVPLLERVIHKVVDFVNVLNQLFAKLSGASTWTKAVMYPIEYAKGLDKATKAAKKWKATILGIDELNLMADNSEDDSDALDYSKMFETVALEGGKVGNFFAGIFDPFVQAWNTKGLGVIAAMKSAFESLKGLFSSIKTSFEEVWTNGTGAETIVLLTSLLQGMLLTISNIATAFNTAWVTDGTGTAIVQELWNIFNSILGTIVNCQMATAAWAATLDFTPLLTSVLTLLQSITPLVDTLGQIVFWIYTAIILPIEQWAIESLIPSVILMVAAALEALQAVLDPVFQGFVKVFEYLKPAFTWFGSFVITVIDGVKGIFSKLAETFREKGEKIKEIVVGIGIILANLWYAVRSGFELLKETVKIVFAFVANIISHTVGFIIDIFHGVIEFIVGIFTGDWKRAFSAIGEIIKSTGLFIWNVLCDLWNLIKGLVVAVLTAAWNLLRDLMQIVVNVGHSVWGFIVGFVGKIGQAFADIWNGLKEGAVAAWEGIKNVFSKVGSFFSDTFSKAWAGVVKIFSTAGEIFVDIKDAVVGAFKFVVNGIIKGINSVIALPFKGINDIFDWLRDIKILGVQPFANLKGISIPEIPLLAEGGIVDSGTAFVAGEAGPEVIAQFGSHTGVMNVSQMAESVAEGVAEANREQNSILLKLLDKDFNAVVSTGDLLSSLNRTNRRVGRTMVPVGT